MITAEQRTQRRSHIGSSDVAAILGLDPFRTARDLYWSKVAPEIPDENKKEFQLGNLLEDAICAYGADRIGLPIRRNVFAVSTGADGGICAANHDALLVDRDEGMEAKYSGDSEEWADEGSDQVPERVVVQAQHQAYVSNLSRVWVPALIIGYRAEFRLYCVPRHDELIEAIVAAELKFWREHVVPGVPPDGNPVPPLKVLKALRRRPNSVAELGDDALDAWASLELAKAAEKKAKAACGEGTAAVLALLGEAEGGKLPDGRLITYLLQNSAPSVDHVRLRALYPEAHAACVTQGQHRTLRIKNATTKKGA